MSKERLIEDKIIKTGKVNWRRFEFLQKESFKEISKKQMDKLKASILNNDFIESYKVWEHDGKVYCLDGYHRCLALSELAAEGYQVPDEFTANFIQCKDMKDAAKKVLVYSSIYASVTDEGLYEFSHDFNLNFDEIKFEIDIPKLDLDRYEAGYVRDDDYNEEEDNVPEPPAEPVSKLGDLYLLGGKHRLLCGDSTKAEDVTRLMDGMKADMVFTDPPYGVSYGDKNAFLNAISRGNHIQENLDNDTLSVLEMKKLWVSALSGGYEVTKSGGSYYICSPQGGELMMMMMMSILEANWELKHCLIWAKNNIVLGRSDYNYQHEPILYGWKPGAGHKFYGEGGESSVWNIPKNQVSDLHPTMKPVPLVSRAIKNSSKPKDAVLDLFAGSGSTLIAADALDRNSYNIEISPHYCDVIIERYKNLTGKDVELIESVGRAANE